MKNKDQIISEILLNEPSETISVNELLHDHEIYNKLMQINLNKENYDIDYETGFFNENRN